MLALLLNFIHVLIILWFLRKLVKNGIDTSLLWFLVCSLFFIGIPLLFDSCLILNSDIHSANTIKAKYNDNWISNGFQYIDRISLYAFIFDLVLILIYIITDRSFTKYKFFNSQSSSSYFFSWKVIFIISYLSLLFFMLNFGISSLQHLGVGEWTENWTYNKWLNLLTTILISVSPVGILKGLYEKKYILMIFSSIPAILIGFITDSRALIISYVIIFAYYFVWTQAFKSISLRKVLFFAIGFFLAFVGLTYFKEDKLFIYPLSLDRSYSDLFYCFESGDAISSKGMNFLKLVSTGIWSFNDKGIETVEAILANSRYFSGWGTLHPTVLGWAYMDLGRNFFLLAAFFGFFLGVFDIIRKNLNPRLSLLYMCIILRFCPIAVRGSVQYAYANAIYPVLFFLIILVFLKLSKKTY